MKKTFIVGGLVVVWLALAMTTRAALTYAQYQWEGYETAKAIDEAGRRADMVIVGGLAGSADVPIGPLSLAA